MIYTLTGGVLFGIAGSLHCIGMCGPLKAVFFSSGRNGGNAVYHLFYDVGRLVIYCIIGLLFSGVIGMINLQFIQSNLSFICALLLSVNLILNIEKFKKKWGSFFGFQVLFSQLSSIIKMSHHTKGKFFLAGMMNGLLPCGLTYMAGMTSAGFGNTYSAVIFMISFWLGSLPAMMFSTRLVRIVAKKIPFFSTILILLVISILVYRGVSENNHLNNHQPENCLPSTVY